MVSISHGSVLDRLSALERVFVMRLVLFAAMMAGVGMIGAGSASAGAGLAGGLERAGALVQPNVVKVAGTSRYRSRRSRQVEVRGFRRRVGGYSYGRQDSINTYGNSRTLFGGANSYRDPALDRQSNSGPFDHGWFFESGVGPRGGNSPYMN